MADKPHIYKTKKTDTEIEKDNCCSAAFYLPV
jgi:hypothetical protein